MLVEGTVVALTVGKVISDLYESDKLDESANNKSLKAMNRMEEAKAAQRLKQEDAKQSMLRLGNRKKGILNSSMKQFLDLYSQLKKINFIETDGVRELLDLPAGFTEEVSGQIIYASQPMTQSETVSTFLVNGVFFGFFGGVSSVMKKDSERNLQMAGVRAKQARAIEMQAQTVSLAYDAIIERSNLITDVLTKLNVFFIKSLNHTQSIIEKNGLDKQQYSGEERQALAVCVNLAVAIKKIIDTPLLDEDGQIMEQSKAAIEMGHQCLQMVNYEMMK
jgi:hypothetical protein